MKQATITLYLSKELHFVKHNITPIEAMLLTAEHIKNVGKDPVEVHEKTITETGSLKKVEVEEEFDDIVEVVIPATATEGAKKKKEVVTSKRKVEKMEVVKDNRSNDDELDRLRAKYGQAKVKALLTEVTTMPTDFAAAIERGKKISLPSSNLSTTNLK